MNSCNTNNRDKIKAYRSVRINTATQGKMIVMLYDEIIRQIECAREELAARSRRYDKISAALVKARDVVTELMVSLDLDKGQEIAKSLFGLYQFFNSKLIEANVKKEAAPLDAIFPLITDLRASWDKISSVSVHAPELQKSGIDISG